MKVHAVRLEHVFVAGTLLAYAPAMNGVPQ